MYIITIILELTPETNHMEIIDFYESEMATASLHLPGVEKITCVQLKSTPFLDGDKTPLCNLFYQIQISFQSEESVQVTLKDERTMKLVDEFSSFSNCKLHWFVGHENTFYADKVSETL